MPESEKFAFGNEEFLGIINGIMKRETPLHETYTPLISMNENFALDRLDSMGMIMFFVWLAELFQIDDDKINEYVTAEVFTVQSLKDFVMSNCPTPYSMDEMRELAKQCI